MISNVYDVACDLTFCPVLADSVTLGRNEFQKKPNLSDSSLCHIDCNLKGLEPPSESIPAKQLDPLSDALFMQSFEIPVPQSDCLVGHHCALGN